MGRPSRTAILFTIFSGSLVLIILWLLSRRVGYQSRRLLKDGSGEVDYGELDLLGYIESSNQATARYHTIIPASAIVDTYDRPLMPRLNVSRLPQTHIYDILQRHYKTDDRGLSQTMADIVPLERIVSAVEKNVVAVFSGIGQALGTGILIHSQLVLTARHCIEETGFRGLNIRTHYQRTALGMDFGESFNVRGVVEENAKSDYAIILLERPVSSFRPVSFNLLDEHHGASILFHHPLGGPKRISVHASLEAAYYQFMHDAFHDSNFGSSGGAYVDASGKVFALHVLRTPEVTGASWCQDIWRGSKLLQSIFTASGDFQGGLDIASLPFSQKTLARSRWSDSYHALRERVERPRYYDNPNDRDSEYYIGIPASYHHIVPNTDMQFLWMMGKENREIEKLVKSICYPHETEMVDAGGELIINVVANSPWNLFVGPTARADDPHDGNLMEAYCPNSFDKALWGLLGRLYAAIQQCWTARYHLSESLRAADEAGVTLAVYKAGVQVAMGARDERGTVRDMRLFGSGDKVGRTGTAVRRSASTYFQKQKELIETLRLIRNCLAKRDKRKIHKYQADDWLRLADGRYRLKGSEAAILAGRAALRA